MASGHCHDLVAAADQERFATYEQCLGALFDDGRRTPN